MPINPRFNGFEVAVHRAGKRYRVQAETMAQAEAFEKLINTALDAGKVPDMEAIKETPIHGKKTVKNAFDIVWRNRWDETKGSPTILKNWRAIDCALGPDRPLDTITAGTVDELVELWRSDGNKWPTINRKMSLLRVVLAAAVEREWIIKAPILPHRKENSGRIRWFTDAEIKAIHDRTMFIGKPHQARLWLFLVDTGARIGESLNLTWRDISDTHVTFWETKNGYSRTVPLTKRVKKVLAEARASEAEVPFPITQEQARWTWDRVKTLLGQDHDKQWLIHTFRHTCASRLVQRGVPLLVVKDYLGHKNIQMTMRYAHLAPTSLDAAAKALDAA